MRAQNLVRSALIASLLLILGLLPVLPSALALGLPRQLELSQ